jgi:class 3 adenylate cyclase
VQQLAEPGQVLLTETTAALLNSREVGTGELGIFELKGVADPVKVYLAMPIS